jgi:hypothetical protein
LLLAVLPVVRRALRLDQQLVGLPLFPLKNKKATILHFCKTIAFRFM